MLRVGSDLIVIGGYDGYEKVYSDSIFKLRCVNMSIPLDKKCHWETLDKKLNIPRQRFVAVPVPDDFIACHD